VGGRKWQVECIPSLEFVSEERTWYPAGVFPLSFAFTGLVVGYLLLFKGRARKIEHLVEERTAKLKQAQLQLIQAEKMESVGRLAAGVAHEVKNPLAIIQLGIDFLKQTMKGGEESAEVIEEMEDAVRRADTVIKGLVDFSRSDKLSMEQNDLNTVLEESLRMVSHELSTHKIALEKHLADDLPAVQMDRNKIQQVFINLFMNAIQAMVQDGTLSVKTLLAQGEDGKKRIKVVIEDTGPGIPDEKLNKIFDPFFTTKPTGKGTGLGLSVVRNIIELHNAEISVQNRETGGASFVITFPTKGAKE